MTGIQLSDKIVPYGDFDMVDASRVSGGSNNTLDTDCLPDSGVTAGSYTTSNITVDAKGRITAASTGTGGVQSNWNETDSNSLAFIENKPTIPSGNQIIDWTASGSGTIHASNYTNTTYSIQDGELSQNNFTDALKSKLDGISTNQIIDWTASGAGTIHASNYTNTTYSEATSSLAGLMSIAHHDKLDGIEANATADQSNAEIRAAVAAATDSNVFTDTLKTKLDGISASANNYSISSDLLDEDDMASDSAIKVPSQQSVKAYVDSNVGLWVNSFNNDIYRASGNVAIGNVNSPNDRLIVRGSDHQRIKLQTTANNKEATIGFAYHATGATNEWCIGRRSNAQFVIAKSSDLTDSKLILNTDGTLNLYGSSDNKTLRLRANVPGILFSENNQSNHHFISQDSSNLRFLYDSTGNESFDTINGVITTNGYWLLTNRLKIGSSSVNPQYPLDVVGDVNYTGTLRKNGTAISFVQASDNTAFSGNNTFTGGNKIVIQNSTNGGTSRGIFFWTSSDSNWGAYMAQSGSSRSLSGGNACSSLTGQTNYHIRFRVHGASSKGFIWENSNEDCLMSIEGDTGNLYTQTINSYTQTELNSITTAGLFVYNETADAPQIYIGSSWRNFMYQTASGDYFFQNGSDVTVFNADLMVSDSSGTTVSLFSSGSDNFINKNLRVGDASSSRLKMGEITGLTGFGCIAHNDMFNSDNYAFAQDNAGNTYINCKDTKYIRLRHNNSTKLLIGSYSEFYDNVRFGTENGGKLICGSRDANWAGVKHLSASTWALFQNANGYTYLDTDTGQGMRLRVGGSDQLQLNGTTAIFSKPITSSGLLISNSYHGGSWPGVSNSAQTAGSGYALIQHANGTTLINCQTNTNIGFRVANSDKMTVSGTNGYVGVWTTSPTSHLHVNGQVRLNSLRSGNNVMTFYNHYMSTYSDVNLKTNVKQINNALNKIEKINGYTFNWTKKRQDELIKDKISKIAKVGEQQDRLQEEYDPVTETTKTVGSVSDEEYKKEYDQRLKWEKAKIKDKNMGVIAQEVLDVVPEIVDMRDDGHLVVAYDKLVPLLIESIKELSEKLKILEGKIK